MLILDAHCDTLSQQPSLEENEGHFDLRRARTQTPWIQVLAAFGPGQQAQLQRLYEHHAALTTLDPEGLTLWPAVEGADEAQSPDDILALLRLRPVSFGLTWNRDNALAGGCLGRGGGLTPLGRETVALLEQARVTPDVAHASEQSFWDILALAAGPVVDTHACCAALCPHPRNLTDAQMTALADRGGVLGLTLYRPFLGGDGDEAQLQRHVLHAVNIMGEDGVGIGTDLDGCRDIPPEIRDMCDLRGVLERLPLPARVVEKIAALNFLRVLRPETGK